MHKIKDHCTLSKMSAIYIHDNNESRWTEKHLIFAVTRAQLHPSHDNPI